MNLREKSSGRWTLNSFDGSAVCSEAGRRLVFWPEVFRENHEDGFESLGAIAVRRRCAGVSVEHRGTHLHKA